MAKYAFFSAPAHGHVNPTLALAQELVARGEQVIYYLTEEFRPAVEATGATLRPYRSAMFDALRSSSPIGKPKSGLQPGMIFPKMIRESFQALPQFLETVPAEHVDYVLHDHMFFPASFLSEILGLPAIKLFPSYASNEHFNIRQLFMRNMPFSSEHLASMNEDLVRLCETYHLPHRDMMDLFTHATNLNIVFQPRAFQPAGETFDERFVFVGPSLQTQRHSNSDFPLAQLGKHPQLYISLGTVFNNQADFYKMCFDAFSQTEWQVVLSFGTRVDRSAFKEPPTNFLTAPHVPQLEVLSQTDVFISHGGMNSTMESLAFGVPLVVIPQMPEQEMTARRVQELGLGIALDRETLTTEKLRTAVEQVSGNSAFRTRVQSMQHEIRESGGYQRAADAITHYKLVNTKR